MRVPEKAEGRREDNNNNNAKARTTLLLVNQESEKTLTAHLIASHVDLIVHFNLKFRVR